MWKLEFRLAQSNTDEITVESLTGNNMPVVMTSDVQRSVDTFSAWLHAENKQPFIKTNLYAWKI